MSSTDSPLKCQFQDSQLVDSLLKQLHTKKCSRSNTELSYTPIHFSGQEPNLRPFPFFTLNKNKNPCTIQTASSEHPAGKPDFG